MLRTFVSEVASRGLRVQAVPALSRGFATSTFFNSSSVVVERPLTLYLNAREIVTMMTIGDHPDALALGYLAVADGSDMGGSLRNPAGWNGVYGFRPTYGRVPQTAADDFYMGQLQK
jgi:amidase